MAVWFLKAVERQTCFSESKEIRNNKSQTVNKYFDNLAEVISKYKLEEKPQNIYNTDETGLQPDHRPPNIIANPHTKPQAMTSPKSTKITLLGCANALGNALPPYFVLKGSVSIQI